MKLLIIIVFISVSFLSCATCNCEKERVSDSSVVSKLDKDESLLKLAKERFGANFIITANKSWEYFLVSNLSKSQFELSTKFFVFDSIDNQVILEDFIRNGSIKWTDDYTLDIQIHPGNIQINSNKNDIGYFFNCKSKVKQKK